MRDKGKRKRTLSHNNPRGDFKVNHFLCQRVNPNGPSQTKNIRERERSWPDNASHIPFEKLETMFFYYFLTKLYGFDSIPSTLKVKLVFRFTGQWGHDGGGVYSGAHFLVTSSQGP